MITSLMQRCFLVSASDAAELPRCASCQLASARRCSARAGSPRLSPSSALATEGTSAKQLKTPQLVFCCPTPLKNHFTSIITLRNWKTTQRQCSSISPLITSLQSLLAYRAAPLLFGFIAHGRICLINYTDGPSKLAPRRLQANASPSRSAASDVKTSSSSTHLEQIEPILYSRCTISLLLHALTRRARAQLTQHLLQDSLLTASSSPSTSRTPSPVGTTTTTSSNPARAGPRQRAYSLREGRGGGQVVGAGVGTGAAGMREKQGQGKQETSLMMPSTGL